MSLGARQVVCVSLLQSDPLILTRSRQIASSDVILLNKCDIASESSIERTERLIRTLNAAASIFRTVQGEVANLGMIIGQF